MDVLLIADLHGNFGKIENFLDLHADEMIVAGDITNFGPVDTVDGLFARIDIPCFAVPGNCDPREIRTCSSTRTQSRFTAPASRSVRSRSPASGARTRPRSGRRSRLSRGGRPGPSSTVTAMERTVHNVLLSHCPPMGALDEVDGQHVGSTSVPNHMKAFDLICCAHIHEQRGVTELDGVRS